MNELLHELKIMIIVFCVIDIIALISVSVCQLGFYFIPATLVLIITTIALSYLYFTNK